MILIVDDIRANIVALKKILELHNLEVDTAESGDEALKKILKNDYFLIQLFFYQPLINKRNSFLKVLKPEVSIISPSLLIRIC
jgi:CheY-like chemotaxis protein